MYRSWLHFLLGGSRLLWFSAFWVVCRLVLYLYGSCHKERSPRAIARDSFDAREPASRIKTSVITALKRACLVLIWMRGRLFRDAILHLTQEVRIMIWNFQLCSPVSPTSLVVLMFFTKNAILISAYSLHMPKLIGNISIKLSHRTNKEPFYDYQVACYLCICQRKALLLFHNSVLFQWSICLRCFPLKL